MLQLVRNRFRHGEELLWLGPVAVACLALFLAAHLIGASHGYSPIEGLDEYGDKALRFLPGLVPLGCLALLIPALLSRSDKPLQVALAPLQRRFGTPLLFAAAAVPLLLMPVMLSAYGLLKVLLPVYAPFSWDDSFAAWDRALFLGYQPWTWTHAVLGNAPATIFIDRLYTLWLLFVSLSIVAYALFAPRYDRARFYLCFTAAWVLLGTAGAYLGSSAGPCYTALLGAQSAPEFTGLFANLNAIDAAEGVHLDSLRWQGVLWDFHASDRFAFGMGISAMPSLHNAIAVLFALSLARFGRHIGALAAAYAVVIFVGSIHLGWHYAVDGIISAAAMLGFWKLSGLYLKRSGYEAAVARGSEPAEAVQAGAPALA